MEHKESINVYTPQIPELDQYSKKPFPGFAQALWILFMTFIMEFLVVVIFIMLGVYETGLSRIHLRLLSIELAAIIVMVFFFKRYVRLPIKDVFFLKGFSIHLLIPLLVTVLGLGIMLSEIDNLLRLILPMPQFVKDIYMQLFSTKNLFISIIPLAILGPIIEELMFRGMILHRFLGRYRKINAIVLSSLLFALMHINPWQLLRRTLNSSHYSAAYRTFSS